MSSQRKGLLRPIGIVASLAAASASISCNMTKAKPSKEAPAALTPRSTLGPGDDVEIKFYYAPELNNQQRVRPDGTVNMQLVGDVKAAGLTPVEFTDSLRSLYGDKLRYPEIQVIVRQSYAQRVLVGGQVTNPGALDMAGPMTLMEAIIMSGGFINGLSNTEQVIVMREDSTGKRTGYAVNLAGAIKGEAFEPFQLQAGDMVYVPTTTIADVNLFIEQYINGVVPDVGFFFRKDTSDGSWGVDTSR